MRTIYDDLAANEPLILLNELRKDRRLGRRPDRSVPFRWKNGGLETVKSPRLATTWSAVVRFFARRSGVTPAAKPARTSKNRQREIERAEKELAREGL